MKTLYEENVVGPDNNIYQIRVLLDCREHLGVINLFLLNDSINVWYRSFSNDLPFSEIVNFSKKTLSGISWRKDS